MRAGAAAGYEKAGFAVYNHDEIDGLSVDNVVTSASTGRGLDIETSASLGVVALQGDGSAQTMIAGDIDTANPELDAFLNGKGGAGTVIGGGDDVVIATLDPGFVFDADNDVLI